MHVDAPAFANMSLRQISQTVAETAPRWPEYLPAGHLEHADSEEAAGFSLYVPAGHSKQRSAKQQAN